MNVIIVPDKLETEATEKGDDKIQGDQDHFLCKEMLISLSILKLHKNP